MIAPRRFPVTAIAGFDKMGASVRDRLMRLNPDGIEEGRIVRGLWRKPTSFRRAKRIVERGGASPWRHYTPGGRVWSSVYQGDYFKKD